MRITALFPVACAIVTFVLSMLCLFAGHKKGFMEDYHIISLNTSTLGHNLIPNTTSDDGPTPTSTSVGSFFSNLADDAGDEITDGVNDLVGDVADKLADKLGIHEWYSLHLMDMCYGEFKPNATTKGAGKNITRCTNATAMYHFEITEQLNKELELGPVNISLSDLGWSDDIQDGLNALNIAVDATFVLYCIGIASAGAAVLTGLVAFFLHGSRLISLGNLALTSLSFLTLLIASIIITIVQKKAADTINKYGNDIGLYAYKGGKYLIITWVAVACIILACMAWIVEICIGRRNKKREYSEKTYRSRGGLGGFGRWRNRRSDEHQLRRSGV